MSDTVEPLDSGTAGSALPSESSSANRPYVGPPPTLSQQVPWFERWFSKWGLTAIIAIFALVVGYFSGIFVLKDDIAELRVVTSVLRSETDALSRRVEKVEVQADEIAPMGTAMAVLQQRLDNMEREPLPEAAASK